MSAPSILVDLLAALEKWRRYEKRHAMMVLGEMPSTFEHRTAAKENADRALHEVRKVANIRKSCDES